MIAAGCACIHSFILLDTPHRAPRPHRSVRDPLSRPLRTLHPLGATSGSSAGSHTPDTAASSKGWKSVHTGAHPRSVCVRVASPGAGCRVRLRRHPRKAALRHSPATSSSCMRTAPHRHRTRFRSWKCAHTSSSRDLNVSVASGTSPYPHIYKVVSKLRRQVSQRMPTRAARSRPAATWRRPAESVEHKIRRGHARRRARRVEEAACNVRL